MPPARVTVLLPCHSLEDFPTWSESKEAEDLLAVWTAAWHPAVIAAAGMPGWASIERSFDPDDTGIAVVPPAFDHRLDTALLEHEASCSGETASGLIRGVATRPELLGELGSRLSFDAAAAGELPQELVEEFEAVGMAWLLSELLARRMRSDSCDLDASFAESLRGAAQAAVRGDGNPAEGLDACHRQLESARARFYPVDIWLVDLVLLAETTLDERLVEELDAPVPVAMLAPGELIDRLGATRPDLAVRFREAREAGQVAAVGGMWDELPLAGRSPEELLASFRRGHEAWSRHGGGPPTVFGRRTGGSSAILPQLLSGLGYEAAIWNLFDGEPLPDPGASRITWEGTGGASIEAIAKVPLDARDAATVIGLTDRLGDAMDHDHTAVLAFAHFAGTASRWHRLLRRFAARGTALGRFVTPQQLLAETAGTGLPVAFEPDAFRAAIPAASAENDPIDVARVAAAREAAGIVAARDRLDDLPPQRLTPRPVERPAPEPPQSPGWLGSIGRMLSRSKRDDPRRDYLLDNGLLRVRIHPRTGGLLSLRPSGHEANRLSQKLSIRSTRPAQSRWEDPLERSDYAEMVAELIEPISGESPGFESRGRLLAADSRELARFRQRTLLPEGAPWAILEIELDLAEPIHGKLLESYAACRFAWNENESIELHRSLHTQSVATQRGAFTAEHFVELCDDASPGPGRGRATILTLGLPWHLRSTPHMLDTILLGEGHRRGSFRLAVAADLEAPWEAAIELIASGAGRHAPRGIATDPQIRVTGGEPVNVDGRLVGAVFGLLESAGRRIEAAVELASEPVAAWRRDARGNRGEPIEIRGRTLRLPLARYEWAFVEVHWLPAAIQGAEQT